MSCRDLIMESFTPEQWESLEFIVADIPCLASIGSNSKSRTLSLLRTRIVMHLELKPDQARNGPAGSVTYHSAIAP